MKIKSQPYLLDLWPHSRDMANTNIYYFPKISVYADGCPHSPCLPTLDTVAWPPIDMGQQKLHTCLNNHIQI